MEKKLLAGFVFLILLTTFVLSAGIIEINPPLPGPTVEVTSGQSIIYYLKIINNNLIGIAGIQTTTIPQTIASTSIKLPNPSISVNCIDKILSENSSPAAGLGKIIAEQGKKYSIDPAIALAFFRKESSFGKNGKANENKSFGNRKDISGNFINYSSWEESIMDWFGYMDRKYVQQGKTTIEEIVPIYVPSAENDTLTYISQVKQWTVEYRAYAVRTC